MNVLNVQNLRKSYGPRTILDGVSFAIDDGEKVGFIGANGSGKSTLFRVVAGLEASEDGGVVAVRRGARVGYLAQEPNFQPGQTILDAAGEGNPAVRQAVAAYRDVTSKLAESPPDLERLLERQAELTARLDQLRGWDWQSRVEAMLTRVGVSAWDRTVDALSGGERKRVALARALLAEPELLLLDEPTNHLDADTVLWLEEHLVDYPGAVMLITHDRYFLDRVVDRMLEVRNGQLSGYVGGYTEYLEAKAEEEERLAAEEEKRRKLIAKELAWARRAPPARTSKQKARKKRTAALEAEQRRYKSSIARDGEMKLEAAPAPRLGRTVLELRDVSKAYDGRVLIRDFSASLRAGQRIGIIGPNGAGKTTLLRILLGEVEPDAGEVTFGVNTLSAYFDQRRSDLEEDRSIYEAIADTDWVTVGGRRQHVRSYLEDFLFPTSVQQQRVSSLSGGEKNRLLLARLFLQESNLLILDEPTNDLDLVTLQVLESVLEEYAGCVLVVTHDRFFLDKVATDLFVFEGDGVVHTHTGGYDLYRRLKEEKEAAAAAARQEQERKAEKRRQAPVRKCEPKKLTWKEQRELEGLEDLILAAEEERDALEARLADPALYEGDGGGESVASVTTAYDEARARVEALYERWAELEEKAAG